MECTDLCMDHRTGSALETVMEGSNVPTASEALKVTSTIWYTYESYHNDSFTATEGLFIPLKNP